MVGINRGLIALMVEAILTVPMMADLRIKVTETYASGDTAKTEYYYKGNCWRSDFERGGGYVIVDSANKRSITVDPVKQQYSVNTFTRSEGTADASQTILIDVETRDTGEQRQMFGHPVRHLITTERRRTEYQGKVSSEIREIITDGWYLDFRLPFPTSRIGTVAVLTTVDQHGRRMRSPKVQITRHGPVPHGFAVWERTEGYQLEVTEFSEAPLDEALFEPPAGFRRVVHPFPGEQLSWGDKLLFGWQQFRDWLASF